MTMKTERDEVLGDVAPTTTAELAMVDLQMLACTTVLTSPLIAPKDLSVQFSVGGLIQPYSRLFQDFFLHDAIFRDFKKDFCCCGGRKRKNRFIDISSTSEFPLSRFAPARKSAQIISRQ